MPIQIIAAQDYCQSVPMRLAPLHVVQEKLVTINLSDTHDPDVFQIGERGEPTETVKLVADFLPGRTEIFVRVVASHERDEVFRLRVSAELLVPGHRFNELRLVVTAVGVKSEDGPIGVKPGVKPLEV